MIIDDSEHERIQRGTSLWRPCWSTQQGLIQGLYYDPPITLRWANARAWMLDVIWLGSLHPSISRINRRIMGQARQQPEIAWSVHNKQQKHHNLEAILNVWRLSNLANVPQVRRRRIVMSPRPRTAQCDNPFCKHLCIGIWFTNILLWVFLSGHCLRMWKMCWGLVT